MNQDAKQKMVDKAPTAPAVNKLMEAFPDIEPDAVIAHEDIERTLDLTRESPRYSTVISAWKAALFNQRNIVLRAVPGVGYQHIVKGERIGLAVNKLKRGIVKVRAAGVIASTTPSEGLSLTERNTRDHFSRVSSFLQTSFQQEQARLRGPMKALEDIAAGTTTT